MMSDKIKEMILKLLLISENITYQDNRITADPIFIVQKKVRDYGYTSEYAESYAWRSPDPDEGLIEQEKWIEYLEHVSYGLGDDEVIIEHSKALKLSKEYERYLEEENGLPEGKYEKVYYKERWEFVTACFTEQGCKDYLEANGHNLKETRIYVESLFRNEEMKLIRKFLLWFEKVRVGDFLLKVFGGK